MLLSDGCLDHGTAGPTSIDAMKCRLEELVDASAVIPDDKKETVRRLLSDQLVVDTVAIWLAMPDNQLKSIHYSVKVSVDSAIRDGTLVSGDSPSGYTAFCGQPPACSIP